MQASYLPARRRVRAQVVRGWRVAAACHRLASQFIVRDLVRVTVRAMARVKQGERKSYRG